MSAATSAPATASSTNKQKVEVNGKDSTLGFALCGAIAGATSRTVAAPFERLKILYQVQDLTAKAIGDTSISSAGPMNTSIRQSLSRVYNNDGWMGFFRGNGANIIRAVPYQAAQYVSYDKYKLWMIRQNDGAPLSTFQRLAAGGLAGTTSVVVSYPLDLVRCRLSADISSAEGKRIYNGIWDCLRQVYLHEGIPGLYRGIVPTILGIAPYVAFNFTGYEWLKTLAINYSKGKSEKHQIAIDNPITKMVLGAISGSISQTIAYPLDVIRRRMQMNGFAGRPTEYHNMWQCAAHIYRSYGLFGFFKGLHLNLAKVIPVVSISFVTYEYTKKALGLVGSSTTV